MTRHATAQALLAVLGALLASSVFFVDPARPQAAKHAEILPRGFSPIGGWHELAIWAVAAVLVLFVAWCMLREPGN